MSTVPENRFRKVLNAPGLLEMVRACFQDIEDPQTGDGPTLADCLLTALAIFGFKNNWLLFLYGPKSGKDRFARSNLKVLYGAEQMPSDEEMHQRLDQMDPDRFRCAFKQILAALQRGGALNDFLWLDHHVVSLGVSTYFSSKRVHCATCCEQQHQDGSVTYYHQMLGAMLVHPLHREAFPLAPEMMRREDGVQRSKRQSKATKRLLGNLRREHPHLRMLVVETMAPNGMPIRQLQELDMRFVLAVKQNYFKAVCGRADAVSRIQVVETEDADGVQHRYRYLNQEPLNIRNCNAQVNFLECVETQPSGKALRFFWITDIEITEANVEDLMRAGRVRWRIGGEIMKTLKSHYNEETPYLYEQYDGNRVVWSEIAEPIFEHNHGHGEQRLATVLASLAMLAFLIEQVQQRCCPVFRATMERDSCQEYFWHLMRGAFTNSHLASWQGLYRSIYSNDRETDLEPLDAP